MRAVKPLNKTIDLWAQFIWGLGILANLDNNFIQISRAYDVVDFPIYHIRDWLRDSVFVQLLSQAEYCSGDIRDLYLRRCMGHKVGTCNFLKNPHFCVLYSRHILRDRWRGGEDVISSSTAASYFYARCVLGGVLPQKMHNQMVLNSFVGKDVAMVRYFEEYG